MAGSGGGVAKELGSRRKSKRGRARFYHRARVTEARASRPPQTEPLANYFWTEVSGRGTLDLHRGTVGKNFRDALHHFGGIVSHADDGVCPVLRRMLQH